MSKIEVIRIFYIGKANDVMCTCFKDQFSQSCNRQVPTECIYFPSIKCVTCELYARNVHGYTTTRLSPCYILAYACYMRTHVYLRQRVCTCMKRPIFFWVYTPMWLTVWLTSITFTRGPCILYNILGLFRCWESRYLHPCTHLRISYLCSYYHHTPRP